MAGIAERRGQAKMPLKYGLGKGPNFSGALWSTGGVRTKFGAEAPGLSGNETSGPDGPLVLVYQALAYWAAGYQLRSRTSIFLLAAFTCFWKLATSLKPFWPR